MHSGKGRDIDNFDLEKIIKKSVTGKKVIHRV